MKNYKGITKTCNFCNKQFSKYRKPSSKIVFCSDECFRTYIKENSLKTKCERCGKIYKCVSKNKKRGVRFCSPICFGEVIRKNGAYSKENRKYSTSIKNFCLPLGIKGGDLPKYILDLAIQTFKIKEEIKLCYLKK